MKTTKTRRALIVAGVVAALAVPAGVAVAATTGSGPAGNGPAVTQNGPRHGGYADPQDCPYYNSDEAQQWRDQREQRQSLSPAQRQQLAEQHRDRMHELSTATGTS